MKKVLILMALVLSACGQEIQYVEGPAGPQGERGEAAPEAPASLEGYYTLPNGGYLDIYEDAQGLFTVRSARIVVVNADGSTGALPVASIVATAAIEEALYYNASMTYVSATHNVQQDSNNADLVGAYLTELKFAKDENGLMTVRIIVTSSTTVLFSTTISE